MTFNLEEAKKDIEQVIRDNVVLLHEPTEKQLEIKAIGIQASIYQILTYLASKGVCVEVEGDLPTNSENDIPNISPRRVYAEAQQDMLAAGYRKVIPLSELMKEQEG